MLGLTPELTSIASPNNKQWGVGCGLRVLVLGRLLVLTLSLLILGCLPHVWAADPALSPNPRDRMMQGRPMGPGMMWGGGMCPMGGPMPSVPFPESQLPELNSQDAALFKTYCAQCHALPSPKSHTPAHWENAVNVMLARMRMMTYQQQSPWGRWMPDVKTPTDDEARALLAYLKHHGLRPAPVDVAPESAGPGAALFRTTCARCHALPHPAQHLPEEWPAVVERMRGHMKRHNLQGIDNHAAEQISAFLAETADD